MCTFGFRGPPNAPQEPGLPGFNGPYWGNVVVALVYVLAALAVARTKRPL